jgi:hypothetical protein
MDAVGRAAAWPRSTPSGRDEPVRRRDRSLRERAVEQREPLAEVFRPLATELAAPVGLVRAEDHPIARRDGDVLGGLADRSRDVQSRDEREVVIADDRRRRVHEPAVVVVRGRGGHVNDGFARARLGIFRFSSLDTVGSIETSLGGDTHARIPGRRGDRG